MEQTIEQALKQGFTAHNKGNLQEAERVYKAVLRSHPKHPEACHNLGLIAIYANQIEVALPLFKTALEVNPMIEQFWLSYIDALVKANQLKDAKQTIKKAKKKGFDAKKLLALLSQTKGVADIKVPSHQQLSKLLEQYQYGRYDDAEKLARSLSIKFPCHNFSWKILGAVFKATDRNSEAVNANQTAVALSPQDAEAHYNFGNTLKELGRLDEAEASYTQTIALQPDYAEAHSNLGNTLQELGRLDEAEATFRQVIALKPNYTEAHSNLGNTLQELGRLDQAEASFRKAIALKPDFADAHYNLGNTLKEIGRLDEAEASFRKAIALKPDFAVAHYNLGNMLKELGRLDEAEVSCRQAIALKPDYAEAHSNLGVTLQELGRLDEALASYSQAIALKPDYAEAHSNLGVTLNAMGSRESALKHFGRSLQLKRGINLVDLHHKSFKQISIAKLDHDIEQFHYIAASGIGIKKFKELAMLYQIVRSEINHTLDTDILHLSDKHQRLLGDTYNRPIHILEAPALGKSAIGDSLDVNKITEDYFEHEFGLTYIDDFLSPAALKSLRKFFLGSTIWFDFFHDGGYMGAYLNDGLASPLILQVAEGLRKKFPRIFKHHQLNHLWAYKYDSRACEKNNSFTGIEPHADFAAVNVNFWITPKSANLDPSSGGLVVYNTEAPLEWGFNEYNINDEKIHEEILKSNQRKTIVPYNENRAVIFNSNLFHETDKIEFREGYENRRINVTMLFGKRGL